MRFISNNILSAYFKNKAEILPQTLLPFQGEDDVWRGHSIAALRRRASELNATASIPIYAHNYEHHVY